MTQDTPVVGKDAAFTFTDADFAAIATIAKQRFGLDLQDSKKPLIYSRLSKRLRVLGLRTFADYCARLHDQTDSLEEDHLLSALTTNVTQFFREPHHFDFIEQKLGPDLIARAKAGRPVRIWSAACSSGEEAYCLAAVVALLLPDFARYDIRILATDIDQAVIDRAQRGMYPVEQRAQIPDRMIRTMTTQSAPADQFSISPQIKPLVTFGKLNLMSDWPMRQPFDVIMCRNAAIYFDKDTQRLLWERFAAALRDGGHLMIGHSERLGGTATTNFESVGITTYRKRGAVPAPQISQMGGQDGSER